MNKIILAMQLGFFIYIGAELGQIQHQREETQTISFLYSLPIQQLGEIPTKHI